MSEEKIHVSEAFKLTQLPHQVFKAFLANGMLGPNLGENLYKSRVDEFFEMWYSIDNVTLGKKRN